MRVSDVLFSLVPMHALEPPLANHCILTAIHKSLSAERGRHSCAKVLVCLIWLCRCRFWTLGSECVCVCDLCLCRVWSSWALQCFVALFPILTWELFLFQFATVITPIYIYIYGHPPPRAYLCPLLVEGVNSTLCASFLQIYIYICIILM